MKKLLSLVLVLLLFSLPALAITVNLSDYLTMSEPQEAPISMDVLEDNLMVYEGLWGLTGNFTAVIENKSNMDAYLYKSVLEGLDKDGKVIFTLDIHGAYPGYVAKGEKAVLHSGLLQITPEEHAALDSWKFTPLAYETSGSETIITNWLSVKAEYEQSEENDYMGGTYLAGKITATLSNDSLQTAFDTNTVVLLRDQEGKLATAVFINPYEVGIPAGNSIILMTSPPRELLSALEKDDRTITTVEALSYTQDVEFDY